VFDALLDGHENVVEKKLKNIGAGEFPQIALFLFSQKISMAYLRS